MLTVRANGIKDLSSLYAILAHLQRGTVQMLETTSLKRRTLNCLTFSQNILTGLSRNGNGDFGDSLSRAFSASLRQENASYSVSIVCEIRILKLLLELFVSTRASSHSRAILGNEVKIHVDVPIECEN